MTDIRETMPDGGAVWTLKLEGNIQGEWVNELRRAWRAVRLAAAGASIRLVLADVQLVDTAGKALLTEMHRDGVGILATDSIAGAIRDEVVDGALNSPGATQSKK
jgi:ABC-type transporter Mla MlaB component